MSWRVVADEGGKALVQPVHIAGAGLEGHLRAGGRHTIDSTLSLSGFLAWLKVPGTAFYAGYSEVLAGPGDFETTERIAFAKAAVLLRP